jgi:hypothetical protein
VQNTQTLLHIEYSVFLLVVNLFTLLFVNNSINIIRETCFCYLYRLRDRRLSVKLVPAYADKGCHVVSVADPYGRNLGYLDGSR